MLDDKEQQEFEHLVDGEYMTQVDDAGFEAALYGVRLALSIVQGGSPDSNRIEALRYLYTFSNWQDFPLKAADRIVLEKLDEEENKDDNDDEKGDER
jgi:hypothetical protein